MHNNSKTQAISKCTDTTTKNARCLCYATYVCDLHWQTPGARGRRWYRTPKEQPASPFDRSENIRRLKGLWPQPLNLLQIHLYGFPAHGAIILLLWLSWRHSISFGRLSRMLFSFCKFVRKWRPAYPTLLCHWYILARVKKGSSKARLRYSMLNNSSYVQAVNMLINLQLLQLQCRFLLQRGCPVLHISSPIST